MALQFCGDGLFEEGEEVAILLSAGGNCRPHAFVIPLARFPPGTLRDLAVDYAVANLLFAMIIRRLDAFDKHESKDQIQCFLPLSLMLVSSLPS